MSFFKGIITFMSIAFSSECKHNKNGLQLLPELQGNNIRKIE